MHSQEEAEGDPEHNSAGAGGCCFPRNPWSPPESSASLLPRHTCKRPRLTFRRKKTKIKTSNKRWGVSCLISPC